MPYFDQSAKIGRFVPILGAKQHYWDAFCASSLSVPVSGFRTIRRACETAREQHDRLGEIDEQNFPHKEIMKVEVQLPADIRVVELLIRYRDREPDIDAPASEAPRFAASMMRDRRRCRRRSAAPRGPNSLTNLSAAAPIRARFIVGSEPQRRLRCLYPCPVASASAEAPHRGASDTGAPSP